MVKRKKANLRIGQTHVQAAQERFPGAVVRAEWVCDDQVCMTVALDSAPDVVEYLYYQRGGWMPVMVGNDERQLNGHYALYYILSMEEEDPCFLMVRVEVPRDTGEFLAVSPKVPAAVWSEREVQDMFGLKALGIIDDRNLVLPDDWPQGIYPLRKDSMDYRFRPTPTTDLENYEFLKDTGGRETTTVPMGPLHITSDEPGHFRLYVEGEEIVDADYRMFYVHRGMEKCAEARMNYAGLRTRRPMLNRWSMRKVSRCRCAPNTSALSCWRQSVCTPICSTWGLCVITAVLTPVFSTSSACVKSRWT